MDDLLPPATGDTAFSVVALLVTDDLLPLVRVRRTEALACTRPPRVGLGAVRPAFGLKGEGKGGVRESGEGRRPGLDRCVAL